MRHEFAEWFVSECIESVGLKVGDECQTLAGWDMAGFARRATPP
jgi:hypothetical protein